MNKEEEDIKKNRIIRKKNTEANIEKIRKVTETLTPIFGEDKENKEKNK